MQSMTLKELIEELTEILDASDGELADTPVLIAQQPRYPLAVTLETVTLDYCGLNVDKYGGERAPVVLWLAEGDPCSDPYAPKHAWDGGEVYPDEEEKDDA